ncbi:unnamed protein product [Meloidogyne enterolobii]|uniref:Uncharacterized protein n=2 Tax=Meloidogyne enterolobii TaxID=390850 RepID=A0ACB1BAA4_MELEN
MELKDKNFDEYQKQIYGLSLIYRIKVKVIKDIINERFMNLYKSSNFPHHNIEQISHGNIEGNYQINNPMSFVNNENLYGNNFDYHQLNLNQFIGGNNQNTEINYLNNLIGNQNVVNEQIHSPANNIRNKQSLDIDTSNNELMKVVESSKVNKKCF